jgi:hypothetical protein
MFTYGASNPYGCSLACTLGDTCGGTLTGSELSALGNEEPYTFTLNQDVVPGYDKTACF